MVLARGLLLLAIFGLSQGAALPEEEVSSHRQAALELLRTMGVDRTILAGADTMIDLQLKQNPILVPYRDVLEEWIRKYLNWETVGPEFVDLYVNAFSEVELLEMSQFYRTPTGRKVLEMMPVLMKKGAAIGLAIAREHSAELDEMIRARASELDQGEQRPQD
ncbi:MAG: DUF2059 domain-containing protein [Acidobacteriota bacterium]